MVDCDYKYCLICFKKLRNDKKEYNVKKDWIGRKKHYKCYKKDLIGRKKHYKCYKKEMDDNSEKVMLANWLLDKD